MAYVYEKVGADKFSRQTPHYGSFEGDGDFIFNPSVVADDSGGEKHDEREGNEVLVSVPYLPDAEPTSAETLGQIVKSPIPSSADRIKLDDLVSNTLRSTINSIGVKEFPVAPTGGDTAEQFAQRVLRYDRAVSDLQTIVILLAHWGEPHHTNLLGKVFARLGEMERPLAGSTLWLSLAYYPVLALMYAGGISALAAGRFDMLQTCLLTPVRWAKSRAGESVPIMIPVVSEITSIFEAFKLLPSMSNKYMPRSEHQLEALQPSIEDQLFLGQRYEELFNQFEIMLALVHGDVKGGITSPFWGPPGRFVYKERSMLSVERPFSSFVAAVKAQGDAWPGFSAGLFGSSIARFGEVSQSYANLITSTQGII